LDTTGTLYVIKNNVFFQIFLKVENFPLIKILKIITQKYHPKNANHPENYVCHPNFTKFTTLKIQSLHTLENNQYKMNFTKMTSSVSFDSDSLRFAATRANTA